MPRPGGYYTYGMGALPGAVLGGGQQTSADINCPAGATTVIFNTGIAINEDGNYVVNFDGLIAIAFGAALPTVLNALLVWNSSTQQTLPQPASLFVASTTVGFGLALGATVNPVFRGPGSANQFGLSINPVTNAVTVKAGSNGGFTLIKQQD